MQNDVRLIDANALLENMRKLSDHHFLYGGFVFTGVDPNTILKAEILVENAPIVDAVPVVRCKDCKNRGTPYSCPMRKLVMPWQGAGSYEDCTDDDGYCHMGVKRDGGCGI